MRHERERKRPKDLGFFWGDETKSWGFMRFLIWMGFLGFSDSPSLLLMTPLRKPWNCRNKKGGRGEGERSENTKILGKNDPIC